jgi:RimJ/RimL family protein N-acetyltransferase
VADNSSGDEARGVHLRIITEPKELIARYVARRTHSLSNPGSFSAVALVNNEDELMAGVVFNGYSHPNILMHIAAERMTPGFIAAVMHYPFKQLGCKRVTGVIDKKNKKSRQFAEHLGAVLEGTMKDASPRGGDVCVYGLLEKAARKWLTPAYVKRLEKEVVT